MGIPEISRRFISGAWRTSEREENGGNGGSMPDIYFTFAFDTADLLSGIVVATLAEGDVLVSGGLTPTVAWNGTTPRGHLCWDPADVASTEFHAKNLDAIGEESGTSNAYLVVGGANNEFGSIALGGAAPLYLVVDDGAGGAAGSTVGEGLIMLYINPAR